MNQNINQSIKIVAVAVAAVAAAAVAVALLHVSMASTGLREPDFPLSLPVFFHLLLFRVAAKSGLVFQSRFVCRSRRPVEKQTRKFMNTAN